MDEHIPDGELAVFAVDPETVSSERRAVILQHLSRCDRCRVKHDHFAAADDDDFADGDTWEPVTGSATLESLLAYATQVAEEDRAAEELLKDFLETPAKAAYKNLLLQSRYLTGGVVRSFTTRAHQICENEPLDALTFAEAAIAIADALPEELYPARMVYELRGTAWKEAANAQMLLGRCPEAHQSLDRAERACKRVRSSGLGLSSVALIRAGVLYQQQRLDEATAMAERAEHGFAHIGNDEGRMSALYLRASIKYESQQLDEAALRFAQVISHGELTNDARWIARGAHGLGHCEIERRDLSNAALHFHAAVVYFREFGPANERVSAEWGVTRVVLHSGKHSEAIGRLQGIVAEFESLGMATDAALAGLDIADGFLALGRMHEIVELAARLFRIFTDAGMLTGALTALAYLREAAAAGTLTTDDVAEVRRFLRRAERQPELLFIRPPKNR